MVEDIDWKMCEVMMHGSFQICINSETYLYALASKLLWSL
jgi:hypothetical protein